jgi:hypothetical protein
LNRRVRDIDDVKSFVQSLAIDPRGAEIWTSILQNRRPPPGAE